MVRTLRTLFPAAALAALTFAGLGCADTGKPEAEKTTLEKVEDKASAAGRAVEDATGTAVKAPGEAIAKGGEKLEHSAADSVRKNVGESAGNAIESTGKALEGAGGSVAKGGENLKADAQAKDPAGKQAEPVAAPVEPATPK